LAIRHRAGDEDNEEKDKKCIIVNYIGDDLNKSEPEECDFDDLNHELKEMLTHKKLIF
jgi:hypothetical protein